MFSYIATMNASHTFPRTPVQLSENHGLSANSAHSARYPDTVFTNQRNLQDDEQQEKRCRIK